MDLAGDERSRFPTTTCAETLQNLLSAPLLVWVGSLFARDIFGRAEAEKAASVLWWPQLLRGTLGG